MSPTGADVLAWEIKRQGVTWVSTLCGNGLNPFYSACRKVGIRLIDTHNEQAAAYIADAYSRLTGHVGVCAVSSGVAHCNALTGVANAFFDGAPVLLITGASSGYGSNRGVFQEFDQVGLAKPICKFSKMVSRVGDLAFLVKQSSSTALSGHPGPVHLTVPIDVLEAEADLADEPANTEVSKNASVHYVDKGLLGEIVHVIETSRCPLIVAGSGVFYSGGQVAILRFSEVSAIPIVTPIWDRGAVNSSHPNFLGVIGAASGEPQLLEDADLIILAGARVDYRVGFLSPPKIRKGVSIIRIDEDTCELRQGIDPHLALPISPCLAFQKLAKSVRPETKAFHMKWLGEAQKRTRLFRAQWSEKPSSTHEMMNGRDIVEAILPLLTKDTIFLIDGGNIGQWAHMLLATDRYPSSWLTCGASGVVGWGIPGAMAAKIACPNQPVLLLSGDGAFGFTITEIESAARQELPFVSVVANDGAWGIVVSGQLKQGGKKEVLASKFGRIRYDKIAEDLGARGIRIEKPKELTSAIREGFSRSIPTVIDVPISISGPADVR